MDRLSGTYKRKGQFVLFLIGLALAIVLNVNTLKIVSVLQHNGQVRTALADTAETFHKEHGDGGQPANATEIENAISSLPVPIGWTFCREPDKLDEAANPDAAAKAAHDAAEAAYRTCVAKRWVVFDVVLAEGTSWWVVVAELVGWLLTGVAISFGAPFWFDLLGQLINIRSAGPKPPRADAQAVDATQ